MHIGALKKPPLQIGNSHYKPSLLLMKLRVAQHNAKLQMQMTTS